MAGNSYWGLTARPCDSCKGSPAVLFCRTDSAYLCCPCDALVHGTNPLASTHGRVWLCEVCEQAPASVTCKADAATLCAACDADIHAANPLARRHERSPVLPFYEPSAAIKPSSLAAFNCGDDDGGKSDADTDTWMVSDRCGEEKLCPDLNIYFADVVDPYLDLDYASGDGLVPVQGKPVVGEGFGGVGPPIIAVAQVAPEIDFAIGKPSYGDSYNGHYSSHSVSSSEVGVVPDSGGGAMADVSNAYGRAPPNLAVAMDREARVMRYREKRKNRKFEKTIRYASRKAYAEARPRIKGRFAKRVDAVSDTDLIYTSTAAAATAAFMVDNGYRVVPSF